MYYTYVLIYVREWGEIRHYFFDEAAAKKYNTSSALAGCGFGRIQGCWRDASLPNYERVHW